MQAKRQEEYEAKSELYRFDIVNNGRHRSISKQGKKDEAADAASF